MTSDPAIFHTPVLLRETVEALAPGPGVLIFDGTLGAGGHSEALLEEGARVIGCDQDAEALSFAKDRLERFGDRFCGLPGNFRDIDTLLGDIGVERVDGILADLGISSLHVDRAERGFSFQKDGPLDMRMNQSEGLTARDIVNGWEEGELIRIFREYGEEPQARRAAQAIVKGRQKGGLETTGELAELLEKALGRRNGRHPGTRVFQALRIAVNGELDVLADLLKKAPSLLNPGGRFAVITFHSLEDKLVKRDFAARSKAWLDRPEWPEPRPNPDAAYEPPSKSRVAGETELSQNRRARSARLRVVRKLNPIATS